MSQLDKKCPVFYGNKILDGFHNSLPLEYILNQMNPVRYQVVAAEIMKLTALWDIAPRSLVGVYRHFRGVYCPHHQGDKSEMYSRCKNFRQGHDLPLPEVQAQPASCQVSMSHFVLEVRTYGSMEADKLPFNTEVNIAWIFTPVLCIGLYAAAWR
jgi:hypothetical protein